MKTCQPPHLDPRPPSFSLPAGACDSHCHVFGPGDVFEMLKLCLQLGVAVSGHGNLVGHGWQPAPTPLS